MSGRKERRRYNRCSFCGKGEDQVRKLVAGPGVFICDHCVELSVEALRERGDQSVKSHAAGRSVNGDVFGLTGFQIDVANLFARGFGTDAIGWCLMPDARGIEVHLAKIWKVLSVALEVPLQALRRQDIYKWLDSHGLLWPDGEVEAMVVRAMSALDSIVGPPPSLTRYERERLETHVAKQRAVLEVALRALRGPLSE